VIRRWIGEWDRACLWALIHNLFSRRAAKFNWSSDGYTFRPLDDFDADRFDLLAGGEPRVKLDNVAGLSNAVEPRAMDKHVARAQ
jgi:hypothetical protein